MVSGGLKNPSSPWEPSKSPELTTPENSAPGTNVEAKPEGLSASCLKSNRASLFSPPTVLSHPRNTVRWLNRACVSMCIRRGWGWDYHVESEGSWVTVCGKTMKCWDAQDFPSWLSECWGTELDRPVSVWKILLWEIEPKKKVLKIKTWRGSPKKWPTQTTVEESS